MREAGAGLGVVVVEYRDPVGAAAFTAALADLVEAEVVVVSTGPEAVPGAGSTRVIHLPSNPGFGAAVNRGVAAMSSRVTHVLVSNTDVRTSRAAVMELWDRARLSGAAILAPTIVDVDGIVEWDGGSIDFVRLKVVHERMGCRPRTDAYVSPTMFITGAHFIMSMEAYARVGGVREDFFLYGEDADFSLRFRRAGLSAGVYSGVRATHARSASVGRSSPTQLYLMTRNNIRLFAEWSPSAWGRWLCWPAVPLRLAFQCARRGDSIRGLLRWIAYGVTDARRSSPYYSGKGRAAALLEPARSG